MAPRRWPDRGLPACTTVRPREPRPCEECGPEARGPAIAAAFVGACRDELQAPKPGNVHVFSAGHGWRVEDFLASAEAAAPAVAAAGARVGDRILSAVEATKDRIGHNTNLGIVLLCAPLACAAEPAPSDLRSGLADVLASLDIEDARSAFKAIALAAPGGLGRAERHDVVAPATVGLREAMQEAADRDRIARQYASGFADIFDLGLPTYEDALDRWRDKPAATLAAYLAFLSGFPDSHIARKHGAAVAEAVRCQAIPWAERLKRASSPANLTAGLLEFDAGLKRHGLNPGTSADLTVATCFTFRLMDGLPQRRKSA